ncbi:hypothetical protein BKA62DRAFT_31758 [Auriculariales sp. MPI-PUGE-AT-0066]|nr:hypothetical protein BKA62DRAFT_31758 [Auriculariales sp. MPI-PUGE-AT-0066]
MQPSLRRLSVNAALRKPQKDLGKWSRPESAPPPPTGPPRAPLTQSLPSNASYNSSPGPNRNQAPRLPPSDYAARREPTGSTQNQRVWRKGDPLSPSTVSSSSSPLPSTPAPPVQPQIDWKNWKPEPKPEFASSRAPYVPRRSTPVRPESSQSWTRQEQQQKPFRPDRFPQPAKVEQPRQYNNANAAASAFAKSLQKQLHEEKLSTDVASEAPTSTDGLRMGQQTSDWRTAITQDGRDSRVQRDQTTDVSQVERDWRPEMNQDGRDSRVQIGETKPLMCLKLSGIGGLKSLKMSDVQECREPKQLTCLKSSGILSHLSIPILCFSVSI